MQRYEALNAIAKLYLTHQPAQARDLFEVFGALLREAGAEDPMFEPFIASFGPSDPSLAARREGLTKAREGFAEMFRGSLMTLEDRAVPEADRRALVGHITRVLPGMLARLAPDRQQALREQLAKLVAAVEPGGLHDDLAALQRECR
jgi:hypothetical protein